MIFRETDNDAAAEILTNNGIRLLTLEDID